jgi:hypothetical protein
MHPTAAGKSFYTVRTWSVDRLLDRSDPWAAAASFWAKFDWLTNIPWTAALEEQEANLHLDLRKNPSDPILWRS